MVSRLAAAVSPGSVGRAFTPAAPRQFQNWNLPRRLHPQKTKHRPPVYPGGRCAASGRELLFYGGLRIFGGLVEFGACLVGGQSAFFAVRGGLLPDVLQLLL